MKNNGEGLKIENRSYPLFQIFMLAHSFRVYTFLINKSFYNEETVASKPQVVFFGVAFKRLVERGEPPVISRETILGNRGIRYFLRYDFYLVSLNREQLLRLDQKYFRYIFISIKRRIVFDVKRWFPFADIFWQILTLKHESYNFIQKKNEIRWEINIKYWLSSQSW